MSCDKQPYRKQIVDLDTVRDPSSFILNPCEQCDGLCALARYRLVMGQVYKKRHENKET